MMAFESSINGKVESTVDNDSQSDNVLMCTVSDDPVQRRGNHLEQREKLGLNSAPKARSSSRTPPPEPTNALQKFEVCSCDCGQNENTVTFLLKETKKLNKFSRFKYTLNMQLSNMQDTID